MTRPPEFRILTDESGSSVEIAVHGELDLATAPELGQEFARIQAIDGLERAVVDLRNLEFLDSSGLETIIKFDENLRAGGAELAIVRGPRAVERLFAVMQLDERLRIVDDPAEL